MTRPTWPEGILLTSSVGKLWPVMWFDWGWWPTNAVKSKWNTPHRESIRLIETLEPLADLPRSTRLYIHPDAHSVPGLTADKLEDLMCWFDVVPLTFSGSAVTGVRTPPAANLNRPNEGIPTEAIERLTGIRLVGR